MRLKDELKENEEAKKAIKETVEDAGMILRDDDLDQVSGGHATMDDDSQTVRT